MLGARVLEPRGGRLHRDLGTGELLALGAARCRMGQHGRDAPAVLSLEARERSEPLLDRLKAPGLASSPSP